MHNDYHQHWHHRHQPRHHLQALDDQHTAQSHDHHRHALDRRVCVQRVIRGDHTSPNGLLPLPLFPIIIFITIVTIITTTTIIIVSPIVIEYLTLFLFPFPLLLEASRRLSRSVTSPKKKLMMMMIMMMVMMMMMMMVMLLDRCFQWWDWGWRKRCRFSSSQCELGNLTRFKPAYEPCNWSPSSW